MPRLENWSVVPGSSDPYMAPELQSICLFGEVYGHPNPRHHDGKIVRTSRVMDVSGKVVKTYSGSVYELGVVSPDYVEWMKSNNIPFDPENPITIK